MCQIYILVSTGEKKNEWKLPSYWYSFFWCENIVLKMNHVYKIIGAKKMYVIQISKYLYVVCDDVKNKDPVLYD